MKIDFTSKELNYIEMALIMRIHSLESDGLKDAGNIPHLRGFSKALVNKIRKERGFPRLSFRLRREREAQSK